ncbi:MAG: alpha-L-rhamnosidase [Victivallales bacterium]|jgi:alpha-L-rhamnosidase|nr:alpha-L-rhamnosidase [Victivallales bacterium]
MEQNSATPTSPTGPPPAWEGIAPGRIQRDATVRDFVTPSRILWQSSGDGVEIADADVLLGPSTRQPATVKVGLCTLTSSPEQTASLLFDFGIEMQGGLQLVMGMFAGKEPAQFRVRFGESASEAMSDIGGEAGATNDHATRDLAIAAPWLGSIEVGNTGFRFVRIDLLDRDRPILLKEVNAISSYRDLPYLGSFRCSDERLNRIWQTGAYTVHLNMQHYLWDGIKRDRLVWIGDMHPETLTVCSVFGECDVVPRSLDYARDTFPLPGWMNGISSYSIWWVIIHHEWYRSHGNLDYLQEQRDYLVPLLHQLMEKIGESNEEQLDGRFLDWPSSGDEQAIHAGLQALMVMAMDAGADLCETLGDLDMAEACRTAAGRLRQHRPDPGNSKQAAALLALSGLAPAEQMNREVLAQDGAQRMSTFYGIYILQAMARAGNHQGAIDCIREYWGGMLDLGATTFWEDFDINWLDGAARIDELVPEGKIDVHASYGAHCYKGLRHSLCHGWASGPTSWLIEQVLGIQVLEPGCAKIRFNPNLADLEWAEGTLPTPHGVVTIRHQKLREGRMRSVFTAPPGVQIVSD